MADKKTKPETKKSVPGVRVFHNEWTECNDREYREFVRITVLEVLKLNLDFKSSADKIQVTMNDKQAGDWQCVVYDIKQGTNRPGVSYTHVINRKFGLTSNIGQAVKLWLVKETPKGSVVTSVGATAGQSSAPASTVTRQNARQS